ncbi:MAG: aldose 1-epimerase family protein [Turicibacter sp.]|nr:aldose 1-epimerase family protein [Turicibacter sp.]
MYTKKNDKLEIVVNPHGAELVSVKKDGQDRLWDGNPAFWGRTSPVLFPIVGAVAEGKYFVDGEEFAMGQHGFARDMAFVVFEQSPNDIWLKLVSNDETRKKYPFDFELQIGYYLEDEDTVTVYWEVVNTGDVTMPFSIGAHPAFLAGPDLDDYSLHVTGAQGIESYVFDNDRGLVDVAAGKVQIVEDLPFIPLSKDLFEAHPTLILEGESEITLRSYTHDREVTVAFDEFPYVGIWAPINAAGEIAPFVCIEPWYGMADTTPEPGELADKKGIQLLPAGESFQAEYKMTFK